MKSISSFILFLILLALTACSDKGDSSEQPTSKTSTTNPPKATTPSSHPAPKNFILRDVDERALRITLEDNHIVFDNIEQPIVLLNFFATWSPPCKGELPDITQLQRENQKDLFVVGILVNDELSSAELRAFMKKYSTNFYISYAKENKQLAEQITKRLGIGGNFPIPLSVLYKNGKLFRYYKGTVPIEMMQSELEQAIKQSKDIK